MARIRLPEGDGTDRQRMWQLRPDLGAKVDALSDAVYSTKLPLRVHEVVRMRIAQVNACPI